MLRLKALYLFENQILKSEMVIFRGRIFYIGKNANPISMVRTENRALLNRKALYKHSFIMANSEHLCFLGGDCCVFVGVRWVA